MDYPQRLAHAIEIAELPKWGGASQLARAIGTTPQAILQTLKGETKALTAENTAKAASFLRVDWLWLATGQGKPRPCLDEAALEVARRFAALNAVGQKLLLQHLGKFERDLAE